MFPSDPTACRNLSSVIIPCRANTARAQQFGAEIVRSPKKERAYRAQSAGLGTALMKTKPTRAEKTLMGTEQTQRGYPYQLLALSRSEPPWQGPEALTQSTRNFVLIKFFARDVAAVQRFGIVHKNNPRVRARGHPSLKAKDCNPTRFGENVPNRQRSRINHTEGVSLASDKRASGSSQQVSCHGY